MTTESASRFHSLLSSAPKTKMRHPMEVIRAAIDRSRSTFGEAVGIEQLQRCVRQGCLGWTPGPLSGALVVGSLDAGDSDDSPHGKPHTHMGRIDLPTTDQAFHIAAIRIDRTLYP